MGYSILCIPRPILHNIFDITADSVLSTVYLRIRDPKEKRMTKTPVCSGGSQESLPLDDASSRHVDPGTHFVWQRHRLGLADILPGYLAHVGDAHQAHRADELVLQDL